MCMLNQQIWKIPYITHGSAQIPFTIFTESTARLIQYSIHNVCVSLECFSPLAVLFKGRSYQNDNRSPYDNIT